MIQRCRVCGCTDYRACETVLGPCHWVERELCSACYDYLNRSSVDSVIAERIRQEAKWGQQDHEPMAWMGILGEEFGELCEAVNETHFNNGPEARKKGGYENMRAEAVQVAAVAISFIEALDRRFMKN